MNKTALIRYADVNLLAHSPVPAAFYVPPYYTNPTASEQAKAVSEQDTYNVAIFARAYLYTKDQKYLDAISVILTNWAVTCTSVSTKDDTPLVACYHWYKVFEAITLIAKVNMKAGWVFATTIRSFSVKQLLPAFQSISGKFNNWQSWSILAQVKLGLMEISVGLAPSVNLTNLKAQISKHLKHSTLPFPIISRSGEMWTENIRGNNALRYTHFSLAPLLIADKSLGGGEDFLPYVTAFANNCRNPAGYYARYGTKSVVGWVMHFFASSSASPELPDPFSWSGAFFFYANIVHYGGFTDLFPATPTFDLGPGGELLYFIENDYELGVV